MDHGKAESTPNLSLSIAQPVDHTQAVLELWGLLSRMHRHYSERPEMEDLMREIRAIPPDAKAGHSLPASFTAAYTALHGVGRGCLVAVKTHGCSYLSGRSSWGFCAFCARHTLVGLIGDALLFYISGDPGRVFTNLGVAFDLESEILKNAQDGPGTQESYWRAQVRTLLRFDEPGAN